MPLKNYGVLKGRAISSRTGSGQSPHYQVHLVDDTTDYRIAINVKSNLAPSELLYLVDDDFEHPVTEHLARLELGFTPLATVSGGAALDFIRGNLFERDRMRALPHDIPGPDNDLNERIDQHIRQAIATEEAEVLAFGERWGPEATKKDRYFGFLPGNGIHDIHMNQGNVGRFTKDDGVWQDGALVVHFPAVLRDADAGVTLVPERWVAVFLAFQSQAWHTDDRTGHTISGPLPIPTPPPTPVPQPEDHDGQVRIVAALVNPEGDDVGKEAVTLLNAPPVAIDFDGWSLLDRNARSTALEGQLASGATRRLELDGTGVQLSNRGGIITLLDPDGLKVDGVSYTGQHARRQRWTIVF